MVESNFFQNNVSTRSVSAMLKNFKILTVTHRRTNLKEIGQFVVSNTEGLEVAEQLQQLKELMNIEELLYLPTCNRVMYFCYTAATMSDEWIQTFLEKVNPKLAVSNSYLKEHLVIKEGEQAINHLLEVSASVDSMVIGEREILRQLREAFTQSKVWGLTGDNIRLAMRYTVESTKAVYAQTRIGEKPLSVVSLAIQKLMATKIARDARILLVGAGQTNTLVCKFLKKYEFTNVTVFNRTLARAQKLSTMVNGKALNLDQLATYKEGFDAMIVCTGATAAIIDQGIYSSLLNGETRTKAVVDLSIPNNVSKEVVDNFEVDYIEIEDLRILSEKNKAFRIKEITNVKALLADRLEEFTVIFQQRKIERAMQHVPSQIKAMKEKAMNEIFKKQLADLDDNALQLVQEMMDYMEKRCIGIPMKAAKNTVL